MDRATQDNRDQRLQIFNSQAQGEGEFLTVWGTGMWKRWLGKF